MCEPIVAIVIIHCGVERLHRYRPILVKVYAWQLQQPANRPREYWPMEMLHLEDCSTAPRISILDLGEYTPTNGCGWPRRAAAARK